MEDNIVFFPKLKDRIINLGKRALEDKNYDQALKLCNQLKEMNEHTSQTELAAVACLLECHKAKEAKTRCEELVFGPFESDEAIEIYISILFQLKEYDVLQKTIKKLLTQKRIDESQMEKFKAMLSLTNKVVSDGENLFSEIRFTDLIENNVSMKKQLEIINDIRIIDCSLILNQIEDILKSIKANPLIQSFILFILQEQSIDRVFKINKMGKKIEWNPVLHDSEHENYVESVLNHLGLILETEDPTAYELAKTLCQHFMTIYFPLTPEPDDERIWAACFYCIVQEYFDRIVNEEEIEELFGVKNQFVQEAISIVKKFENEGYFDFQST